jgi:hypothetical protein
MSVKMKMTVEKFSVGVFDVCRNILERQQTEKTLFFVLVKFANSTFRIITSQL